MTTMAGSDLWWLVPAFAGGGVLGFIYFGGLWLTVRRIPRTRRPGMLSFLSFFGRLALTLCGFYLIMGGHWERLLVAVLGFVAVRCFAIRRWGPAPISR